MMYRLKGLIYGVISSATFGLIPLFALPAIRNGIGVDSVMFYRFGISALVLGLWLVIRRYDLRISGRELFTLAGLGIFYAMTALLLTTSYLYIPSGIATTIHFLYPVVVTTVMILFFKDKVSVPVIGATLMAILGVYLLSNNGTAGTVSLKGLLLVLTTVVTYALYIVGVNKSCVHRMDGLKLTFYVLLAGAMVFGLNLSVSTLRSDSGLGNRSIFVIIGFDSDIGFRFYVNLIGTACRLDDYGCIGMYGTVDCRMYGCLVSARKPGLLAIGRDCDYFVGGIGCHSGQ